MAATKTVEFVLEDASHRSLGPNVYLATAELGAGGEVVRIDLQWKDENCEYQDGGSDVKPGDNPWSAAAWIAIEQGKEYVTAKEAHDLCMAKKDPAYRWYRSRSRRAR